MLPLKTHRKDRKEKAFSNAYRPPNTQDIPGAVAAP